MGARPRAYRASARSSPRLRRCRPSASKFSAASQRPNALLPINARLTPVNARATNVQCFDLQADCVGAPVSGYYARPAGVFQSATARLRSAADFAAFEAAVERDGNVQITTLRQDGWEIRYTRYAAQQPDSLPLRMKLQRDGMELQVLVDEWEIQ